MSINIIVAMTKKQVIGNNNQLIWNLKEDMKLFKEKTNNQTVIMGRNTWESIPKKFRPLPNRNNIVLSRSMGEINGAIVCKSIEDSIKIAEKFEKEIYCIGGAKIYSEFLPLSDILHISWVKKNYEGNILFPKINFDEWKEISSKEFDEFIYKKYKRINKI